MHLIKIEIPDRNLHDKHLYNILDFRGHTNNENNLDNSKIYNPEQYRFFSLHNATLTERPNGYIEIPVIA